MKGEWKGQENPVLLCHFVQGQVSSPSLQVGCNIAKIDKRLKTGTRGVQDCSYIQFSSPNLPTVGKLECSCSTWKRGFVSIDMCSPWHHKWSVNDSNDGNDDDNDGEHWIKKWPKVIPKHHIENWLMQPDRCTTGLSLFVIFSTIKTALTWSSFSVQRARFKRVRSANIIFPVSFSKGISEWSVRETTGSSRGTFSKFHPTSLSTLP